MGLFVEHVEVWAAPIPDRPGGLAEVLRALHDVEADLQCVIARRAPELPGKGVVFVTPLQGDREIAAAAQIGFNVTHQVHSIRVMGHDRPGIATDVAQTISDAGINLRGFTATVIGTQFVAFLALDTRGDADRAFRALTKT